MKIFTTLICLNLLIAVSSWAQVSKTTGITTDGLEVGVHAGHFFSSGNIDFKPGFGAGVHLRKSLDYIFSLRLDLMAGKLKGEDDANIRNHETTLYSGALQGIVTLNNLKWSPRVRKTNIYALFGVGIDQYSGSYVNNNIEGDIQKSTQLHLESGLGVAFKITDKLNIGIEHKVMLLTSEAADLIDGTPTFMEESRRLTFRDVPNYTSVRLNFNLGQAKEKTQPLYWLNPIESIIDDLQLLKDTQVKLTDEDQDGIINQLDEEADTPENARVNPKGVSLDSDKDGIPDYLDKEPFSLAETPVDDEGVAIQTNVMEEAEKLVEEKLKDFQPKTEEKSANKSNALGYLPFVYFAKNSAVVRNKDYGVLSNVAKAMVANNKIKFVVTGHTDESGKESTNLNLSYQRAKNVLNFLVKSGVSRSQLILQYQGKNEPLVAGEATVNRRVGFQLANGDSEMAAPSTQN